MKRYRDLAGDGGSDIAGQVSAQHARLRARLGAAGRTLVERRYRWEAIGADLADFYQELLVRRRQSPGGERCRRSLIG